MNDKILVAYASGKGSTREIAQVIGELLRRRVWQIDVRLAQQVTDLSAYHGVILGSAIYNGAWMPEAQHFVERHRGALQQMPVALFAVCMTMAEDTAHSRLTVLGYLDPVLDMLPNVEDQDVGLFAGAFDPTLWSPLYRMLLKRSRILLYGDFRRWDLIEKWTEYIDGHILRRRERESA